MGCASIDMPPPISFPSVCMGEETCEARKNAETLSSMGFNEAGLVIMCSETTIQAVLWEECGSDTLQNP